MTAASARNSAAARANLLLPTYLALGAERSTREVFEIARAAGVKTTVKTIERYSSRFGWVAAAAAFDEERTERAQVEVMAEAVVSDQRLQQEALAFRQVGLSALNKVREAIASDDSDLALHTLATAAPRLWKEGFTAHRLLSGQATERHEISVQLWQNILVVTRGIFIEHSEWAQSTIEKDPTQVRAVFATFLDRLGVALDRSIVELLGASGVQVEVIEGEAV